MGVSMVLVTNDLASKTANIPKLVIFNLESLSIYAD